MSAGGYPGGGQSGYPSPYPQQPSPVPYPSQQSPYPQPQSAGGMYPPIPQQQSFTSRQQSFSSQQQPNTTPWTQLPGSRLQSMTNAGQQQPTPRAQSASTPQRAIGSDGPRAQELAKADADDEEPGFFGRLFGGKKKAEEPPPAAATAAGEPTAGNDPNLPPVQVANISGWCASKPLDPETAEMLKSSTVAPSRFGFLNPPGIVSSPTGGITASETPLAPGTPPIITSTAQAGPPPPVTAYGPFLRFGGYDPISHAYYASVLVVAHQSKSNAPPTLKFCDVDVPKSETAVKAQHLEHYRGFNFWRFDMTILCGLPERTVEYAVVHSQDHFFAQPKRHRFVVPGIAQKWRWGFYTCNGFHDHEQEAEMGGIQPLWRDVLFCHQTKPMHVMIGGGDQLYCDDVWNLPTLSSWLQLDDVAQRLAYPFTQEMSDQVEWFYFTNYIRHWSQPKFSDALGSVPQAMIWDDHDIFDGWGSYPMELQFCPVFQGIFFFARKFFCLFQQHTTPEKIYDHNQVFGEFGWNWLGCLGSSTAVLMLDTRTERSRDQCVRPGSWAMVQQRIAALPSTVKHLVVVASVPVVYPQVKIVESSLKFLTGQGRTQRAIVSLMQKTGLSSHVNNQFGIPDLLDDLMDHWGAKNHKAEKTGMLQMMQDMAQARGLRVTFLSGDVHVAAVGRFCSKPVSNLRTDHRFMPQIISSAIGNAPPPKTVVKALACSVKTQLVDEHTQEMMIKAFDSNTILKSSRNWCLVQERHLVAGSPMNDGALLFQIRVERPEGRGQRPEEFDIMVPVLDVVMGAFAPHKLKPFPMPGPPPLIMPGGLPPRQQQQQQPAAPPMGPYGPIPLGGAQQQQAAGQNPYGPGQQQLQGQYSQPGPAAPNAPPSLNPYGASSGAATGPGSYGQLAPQQQQQQQQPAGPGTGSWLLQQSQTPHGFEPPRVDQQQLMQQQQQQAALYQQQQPGTGFYQPAMQQQQQYPQQQSQYPYQQPLYPQQLMPQSGDHGQPRNKLHLQVPPSPSDPDTLAPLTLSQPQPSPQPYAAQHQLIPAYR